MFRFSLKRWLSGARLQSDSSRPAGQPRKERRVRPALEALEDRVVPVVGATAVAAPVTAGSGFDGVALLVNPGGTANTASLIYSGVHVVTTASNVTNAGTATIQTGDYVLHFDLPGGTGINIVVRQSAAVQGVSIHSSYNGTAANGTDIAVLGIPDQDNLNTPNRFMIAPLDADRYLIYPLGNEVSRTYTIVGYGETGTGTTGGQAGTGGTKRQAQNQFGADATGVLTSGGLGLLSDFDDGNSTNNTLGDSTGLGASEGSLAAGDTGAPALIGNLIAGIAAGFVDNGNAVNFDFGDRNVFTRASAFQGYVNTAVTSLNTTGSGRYHLVLDMDYQRGGNDGTPDIITISRAPGNMLRVNVNGVVDPNDYDLGRLLSFTVRGSSDDDTVIISDDLGTPDGGIPVCIDGQGGNNTLTNGTATDHTWTINGANAGSIDFTMPAQFSNMQNLTGGVLSDLFLFSAGGSVAGNVDGGTGGDALDYSGFDAPVTVNMATGTATGIGGTFANIVAFVGSNQQDTLAGLNAVKTWDLSASGAGSVAGVDFTSFENLVGGALDDHFNLDFSVPATAMTLDGGAGRNSIRGPDAALVWQLTAAGAGNIQALNLAFNNMQDLTGGNMRDIFRIGQGGITSGHINGGGGVNWLDYSAVRKGMSANLASGAASRILGGIVAIHHLVGSAIGADRLVGLDSGSVVVGHGGGNVISSGGGRDLLIGGLGRNTVNGGGGDDLLIAGRTVFDSNYDALEAILAIWKNADAYNARVAALRTGPNRLTCPSFVGQTVIVTQTVNTQKNRPQYGRRGAGTVTSSTLRGQTGQDWFFAAVAANAVDRARRERLH